MSITEHPLPLDATGTARMNARSQTSTGEKLSLQHLGIAANGGGEPAQTRRTRTTKNWNEMTHDERVANLPELVSILDDGRSSAFREVMVEMLADIAGHPTDLLLLMKPTRQSARTLPPRLRKLMERAEDESWARGARMSGGLSALSLENGIMVDRISLRTDAPGIAVQVGNDESNQALIVCEGGEWQVHVCGPRFPNGGIVPFASAGDAVRAIASLAADFV